MDTNKLVVIGYILEQFKAMGATQDDLKDEMIEMLNDNSKITSNLDLLGIDNVSNDID